MPHTERLLLGPGPSNPYPEAVAALTRPVLGHLDPEVLDLLDETMQRLRDVFRTKNALTLPISGTGSAGMEACFVNLLEPGDTVIVGVNGVFGERMAEGARRCGADVVLDEGLEAAWERHRRVGERLHRGLPELNFRLASDAGHRLPQLTAAWLPEGADDAPLRKGLLETYGIEVGAGLGEFAGLAWRIGLMGNSARDRSVTAMLGALRELL